MICPACRHDIPDNLIACPLCTSRKSEAAYKTFQHGYLRRVAAGESQLKILPQDGVRHILMVGVSRGFCGRDVRSRITPRFVTYGPDSPTLIGICNECREAVKKAIEEISQECPTSD